LTRKLFLTYGTKKKTKEEAFRCLPLFITPSGRFIVRSSAILRYIGREFGCYGTNLEFTDQIMDFVQDWENSKSYKYFLEDTKKPNGFTMENYHCSQMDAFTRLKDSVHTPFFGGEKPSIADYYLFDILFKIQKIFVDYKKNLFSKKYNRLKEWYNKLRNRPNVKKYLNNWTSSF